MPSLFSADDRRALTARLDRLTPDARPRWGRMTAPQMLAHLADAMRMAMGELPVKRLRLPLHYPPLKQLIVYLLPLPKGAPTAPEIVSRRPDAAAWATERRDLDVLIARCGAAPADFTFAPHPAFGTLSRRAWGVLGYRHIDHHLRQFGV